MDQRARRGAPGAELRQAISDGASSPISAGGHIEDDKIILRKRCCDGGTPNAAGFRRRIIPMRRAASSDRPVGAQSACRGALAISPRRGTLAGPVQEQSWAERAAGGSRPVRQQDGTRDHEAVLRDDAALDMLQQCARVFGSRGRFGTGYSSISYCTFPVRMIKSIAPS